MHLNVTNADGKIEFFFALNLKRWIHAIWKPLSRKIIKVQFHFVVKMELNINVMETPNEILNLVIIVEG